MALVQPATVTDNISLNADLPYFKYKDGGLKKILIYFHFLKDEISFLIFMSSVRIMNLHSDHVHQWLLPNHTGNLSK